MTMNRDCTKKCVRAGLAAVLAGCFLSIACSSIPTDIPVVDSRWVFEVKSTTIGVDGLLPAGVSVSGDAFAVAVDSVTAESSLRDLCAECEDALDAPVPKPAFNGRLTATAMLPAAMSSAELAAGDVAFVFRHDFDFDPLRPAGGTPGRLTVVLTEAGGREVARLVLDGNTDSLPPNAAVARTVALTPGAVGARFAMTIEIDSPAGGRDARHLVLLRAGDRVKVSAAPAGVRVSSARVNVAGRRVSIVPAEIGVEDVDGGIVDRIQSGAIVLDIANPFGTGLTAQMRIFRDGEIVVAKDFMVAPTPNSTVSFDLTADEFRTFLGRSGVQLGGSGVVTSPARAIVVAPSMEVEIDGKVDLTLRVGG